MFWRKSSGSVATKKQSERECVKGSLIIANWKCHKSFDEAKRWIDIFASLYVPRENLSIVIAPTFLCLERVAEYVKELSLKGVYLAAQDVSPFPSGSYTGAISADMIKGLVDYVIVGHSERRRYFHETVQDVANKVEEALDMGIIPIICVDDKLSGAQLNALNEIDSKMVIIAYSPVDALNFRIPEDPERVKRMAQAISNNKRDWPVIYGGSVIAENCSDYMQLEGVSGIFVGAASLDPASFAEICKSAC